MGRFSAIKRRSIEFRNFEEFFYNEQTLKSLFSLLSDDEFKRRFKLNGEDDFELNYMIESLMSRGFHVKDQLLELEDRTNFINRLEDVYTENRKVI